MPVEDILGNYAILNKFCNMPAPNAFTFSLISALFSSISNHSVNSLNIFWTTLNFARSLSFKFWVSRDPPTADGTFHGCAADDFEIEVLSVQKATQQHGPTQPVLIHNLALHLHDHRRACIGVTEICRASPCLHRYPTLPLSNFTTG